MCVQALDTLDRGFLAVTMIGLIYIALIWIGTTTLAQYKISTDGGVVFNQIATHYLGNAGHALLAVLITVTCLTTAVGLVQLLLKISISIFRKLVTTLG